MSRLSSRIAKAENTLQKLRGGDFVIAIVQPGESHQQALEREGVNSNTKYCLSIDIGNSPDSAAQDDIDEQIQQTIEELKKLGVSDEEIDAIIAESQTEAS